MAAQWIRAVTGQIKQKKQYKRHMARIEALPDPYGDVAKAFNRYFMYYGAISDGNTLVTMLGDHTDLWERAAVDGTSVRDVVGGDPVEFAEEFVHAYTRTEWIDKERRRLTKAVDAAAGDSGEETTA